MYFKALRVVFVIKRALNKWSYKKVLAWIEDKPSVERANIDKDVYREQVVRGVRAVARRFLGDSPCLPQALAVKWMMKDAGVETELKIGVSKKSKEELEAHAWLEMDGKIIIGGQTSPYYYQTFGVIGNKAD